MSTIIYLIVALVSVRVDKMSPVQERVIPVQDNKHSDRQRYVITIETGSQHGSGTTAKVSWFADTMNAAVSVL